MDDAMTPSDLETYVRQAYNAVGDNFFPQAEILNHFYTAQMQLATLTNCIQNVYTTTSVQGQREYSKPTRCISIFKMYYNGERMRPNDLIDDDAVTGNRQDDDGEGTPINYQEFGENFYVRPLPSDSTSTFRIYSFDAPNTVTASGTLDVPSRYHMYLADYALFRMFAKDKNQAMADYHKQLWEDAKKEVAQIEKMRMVGDEFRVVKGQGQLNDGDEVW